MASGRANKIEAIQIKMMISNVRGFEDLLICPLIGLFMLRNLWNEMATTEKIDTRMHIILMSISSLHITGPSW